MRVFISFCPQSENKSQDFLCSFLDLLNYSYKQKATNKSNSNDLTESYEKQRREREFQQEMRDKEYFDHKRLTEYWNKRQSAAASYEANVVVEPVEGSGFDSAMAGTIV